jgi:carbon-monoxide dehydrogenase small subunit
VKPAAAAPKSSARVTLSFTVNGARRRVTVPPMKRLLDVLREDCALTGTKEGCGEGECGACTVLIDGRAVNSCLVPAVQADGATLLTVEGLARGPRLSALQTAFVTMGGAQCGICTPGILLSAHELLRRSRGRVPGDPEVREALAGNLCRCTGYQKIVDAVRAAAKQSLGSTNGRPRARGAKPAARAARKRTHVGKKPAKAAKTRAKGRRR